MRMPRFIISVSQCNIIVIPLLITRFTSRKNIGIPPLSCLGRGRLPIWLCQFSPNFAARFPFARV